MIRYRAEIRIMSKREISVRWSRPIMIIVVMAKPVAIMRTGIRAAHRALEEN